MWIKGRELVPELRADRSMPCSERPMSNHRPATAGRVWRAGDAAAGRGPRAAACGGAARWVGEGVWQDAPKQPASFGQGAAPWHAGVQRPGEVPAGQAAAASGRCQRATLLHPPAHLASPLCVHPFAGTQAVVASLRHFIHWRHPAVLLSELCEWEAQGAYEVGPGEQRGGSGLGHEASPGGGGPQTLCTYWALALGWQG